METFGYRHYCMCTSLRDDSLINSQLKVVAKVETNSKCPLRESWLYNKCGYTFNLLQGHQAWQLWVTNQEAARDHHLQLSSTFRPRPPLNTLEIVHLRTPPTILTAGTDKPVEQEVTLLSITRQFTLNPQEIPWIPSLPIRIPKTWRMNRWRSSLQQNFGKSLTDRLTVSICTRPYRFIFLTPCVVLLSFTQTVVLKLEWQKVYRYFGSFVYFVKRTS